MNRALPSAFLAALLIVLPGASALAQNDGSTRPDGDSRHTSDKSGETLRDRPRGREAREEPIAQARNGRDSVARDSAARDSAAHDSAARDSAARGPVGRDDDGRSGEPRTEPALDEPAAHAAPSGSNATRSWLARDSSAPVEGPPAPTSSSTGLTLGAVLIVLGLAAAAITIRYRRKQALPITPSESRLTVLSSSRVGPKALAVTAHVNGRVLLLGVTDHTVTHLGWLDGRDPGAPELEQAQAEEPDQDDDLPDDYPGSALRASKVPATFASSSRLERFQEVLRGAEEARSDLPMRPSYAPGALDAASLLAAQTSDVVGGTSKTPAAVPVSLRRKRRARESLPPRAPTPSRAPKAADPSFEGQVAGLRALRNGG